MIVNHFANGSIFNNIMNMKCGRAYTVPEHMRSYSTSFLERVSTPVLHGVWPDVKLLSAPDRITH